MFDEPIEKKNCGHDAECVVADMCNDHSYNAKRAECPMWNYWLQVVEREKGHFREKYRQEITQKDYSIERMRKKIKEKLEAGNNG